ncbi:serine hydrolase domain-containing protein [Streptomyces sp. NPDC049040]|uniref:serine hydrolase domain-containing protein n=1 Tax=Streptomyces sp. NPDC049040 TaxID=3365593 RepID=UPI0037226A16
MAPPLSRGTCPEAGLDADEIGLIVPELAAALEPAPAGEAALPWCAGAVVLAGRGPVVALHEAVGWAVRYRSYDGGAGRGVELPAAERVPMRPGTVFDLASLTKLFTAVAAVQQVEAGALDPDRPITAYVPGLVPGITLRHLLTHTSGLRPELPLYDLPGPGERAAALAAEQPLTPPGERRCYSDLNLLLTQTLLEQVTGRPLDRLVADGITTPLGMAATRFAPPPSWLPRIAATEDQRRPWGKLDRGMVHGTVHDENAYAMGGVAGHAGLFSTAWDLAVFATALLDGTLPLLDGLGFETDQPWFMGELAGRGTFGHTGFTGTSLVIDPATGSYLVLLANTVHPVRHRQGSVPRARAASRLARAAPVR